MGSMCLVIQAQFLSVSPTMNRASSLSTQSGLTAGAVVGADVAGRMGIGANVDSDNLVGAVVGLLVDGFAVGGIVLLTGAEVVGAAVKEGPIVVGREVAGVIGEGPKVAPATGGISSGIVAVVLTTGTLTGRASGGEEVEGATVAEATESGALLTGATEEGATEGGVVGHSPQVAGQSIMRTSSS
jgi:hypothetical protein